MDPLAVLQKKRAELVSKAGNCLNEAKKLADSEGRNLTDEEVAAFDAIKAEADGVATEIEAVKAAQAAEQARTGWLEDAQASLNEPTPRAVRASEPVARIPDNTSRIPAEARAHPENQPFATFGEQLRAGINAAGPSAIVDPRLISIGAAISGASESISSDGGFLVQSNFTDELWKRTYMLGEITTRCQRTPVGPNANGLKLKQIAEDSRVDGSRWGGAQGYWVDEGGELTASKLKFRQIEWKLKKLAALSYVTDELLEDAVALESEIRDAFSNEFSFKVEDAIVNGNGAGQPLGILNSLPVISVAAEVGQLAATVEYENIVNMWARLWARSQQNAVWLINQDVTPQLYNMGLIIGTGGTPAFLPPGGLSGSPFATLFGRPIIPVEYCQTLGTVGDIILADLSQYKLIDKVGLQSAVSIHFRFNFLESTFRFVLRIDGAPVWPTALTPKNGTNTLSPFITLATRP